MKRKTVRFLILAGSLATAATSHAQSVFTWNGGSGNWSNSSFWTTGVPNSGNADVFIDGGKPVNSVVTMDGSYTVGRLTLDAGDTLNIANNVDFTVQAGAFAGSGSIINNGTINFNSQGNGIYLHAAGSLSLTGSGTINLNGGNNQIFANTAGDRITIGTGQTIAGTGNLGAGQTVFTNNGTVTANQSGNTLLLQPGGGGVNDFTNGATGVLRAENGGNLQLTGGSGGRFVGGTLQALAGSQVQLSNGANLVGATLSTTGTGTVNVLNTATLTNVTNTGALVANNNAEVTLVGTLTNNGTLNLNSQGNGIFLRLSGPVTLAGAGTTTLNGGNNQIFANTAGDRLTIGAGQTIAGTGNLGVGQTVFTNNGVVTANQSGLGLVIQPGGGGANDFTSTATGRARAENGGVLQLTGGNGGTFGGLFEALNGSQVRLSGGANLVGATLSTTGTGTVNVLNTATLTNVTNTGALVANNNAEVTLVGTLTNNGTLNLNSQGNGIFLRLSGPVTLAGAGTTTLNGGNNQIFANTVGDRLTIGAGQTIAGTGNLGVGQTVFTNNGVVTANQSGLGLVIQPGGGNGNDFTNAGAGVARAENGGTLILSGANAGTFNAGTFQALTGSQVQLSNGANVVNATLATTGTGTTTVTNTATLTNVTNTGALIANNNSTTTLVGTLTNNGTFNLNSLGNGDDLRLSGPVTLAGTGVTNLNGSNNRVFANTAGDRLTIAAGATLAGTANLGSGQTTFTNNGTVTANQSGLTLTVQPGGGNGNDFTNGATGIARAENGGTLLLTGASGGVFTNNGIFAVNPASALNVSAGALTNYSGTTLTGGRYLVTGSGAANGGATLNLGGGTIATNAATVVLSGSNSTFAEINTLATNQGTFGVVNGRNFTTVGALSDPGIILVGASSALTVTGNLTEGSTGTLAGSGTLSAANLSLAGTVSPGGQFDAAGNLLSGVGTLRMAGATALSSSAVLVFELGAANFVSSDHLIVTGNFTLDGTLNVTALAGFGAGRYDLVDYTGAFTNNVLNLGTVPAGYTYQIDTSTLGRVDLVVSAVPEPGTWMWLAGGVCALAGWTRRKVTARRRAAC